MAILGELASAVFGWLYDQRLAVALASLVGALLLTLVARRRRWPDRARRHPRASIAVAGLALAVVAPVTWYTASPLLLSASIDEPAPIITAPTPVSSPRPAPVVSPGPSSDPAVPPSTASAAAPSSAPAVTAQPLAATRSGPFHGSDEFHFGRGTAHLIETAPGTFVVRLEDFAVRNGPDLYVYLSPDADGYARGAIELGPLKADRGNQNYAVPTGAFDGSTPPASVVIWCRQFSHLFATAPLGA